MKWTDIRKKSLWIEGSKTENAPRALPLFEELKQLIRTISQDGDFLFPISYNAVQKITAELNKKLSFHLTPYRLRHTFATMCAEKGIKDATIQKWMGHYDSKFTRETYIDILDEYEQMEAAKFKDITLDFPLKNKPKSLT